MKHSFKTGLGFGIASGVITTLGLIIGLHSTINSRLAVIGAVLIIALADAFSDALGIHLSKEYENIHSTKEIWESTLATFFTKFFVTLSFIVPILIFSLHIAIRVDIFLGFLILILFSFHVAKERGVKPLPAISEHLLIAVVVMFAAQYLGLWIKNTFI